MDILKVQFESDNWTIENLVDLRDFSVEQRARLIKFLRFWAAQVEELDHEREADKG